MRRSKGGGKLRPLGIPVVRNRVAQEALRRLLNPLFEPLFHDDSHATTFKKSFAFLGFSVQSHSVRMRAKSVEKFKNRVRELTRRSHNLDAERIEKFNAVTRGVDRYFATPFSTCRDQFRGLDRWLRMRIRNMKTKRKHRSVNYRYKNKHLQRWGLIFLSDYLCSAKMTSLRL